MAAYLLLSNNPVSAKVKNPEFRRKWFCYPIPFLYIYTYPESHSIFVYLYISGIHDHSDNTGRVLYN